jgi:hypothetical protein
MNGDDPFKDLPQWNPTPKAPDPFASLPPATSAIAEGVVPRTSMSVPPEAVLSDKYRQAAVAQRASDVAGGIAPDEGAARLLKHGATLGWADTVAAGGNAPFEMYRRGANWPEAYAYAKAYEDLQTKNARENTGKMGPVYEALGGLTTGSAALGPATKLVNPGLNYLKNVGGATVLGGIGGAGAAPTTADVPEYAGLGSVLGFTGGVAGPAVPYLAKPLTGRMRGADEAAAQTMADLARRARVSPEKLVQEITDASTAGQPFTAADVFGKEGQRALTTYAKTTGEQRNVITDLITGALPTRARNMPYRLEEQLGEGLGVQGTAQAAARSLRQRAGAEAAPYYAKAEGVATDSPRIREFVNDPISQQALRHGVQEQRIAAVGDNIPFNPTHAGLDAEGNIIAIPNVRTLQTLKIGLDKMIEDNTDAVTGNVTRYGRALVKFKNGLNSEMGALNPDYAEANRLYAGPMQVRDAIQTGREMVTRGRYADTVPAFQTAPATEQQGQRIGAVDKILEQAEKGRYPNYLTRGNLKGTNELEAMSLYQGPNQPGMADQLRRRLDREQVMRETERAALGGSSTFENAADAGMAPGGLPGAMNMATSVVHGNPVGFARGAYETAAHFLRGETEKQRMAIARALMTNEPTAAEALGRRIAEQEARRKAGVGVYGTPYP